METPLDRLDPMTLHGLMRAMMSAMYEDAIDAKHCAINGTEWDPELSRGKELERSLVTLSQCVEKAMEHGELTPFKGDYVQWLTDLGFISPRQKDVKNEQRR